MYYNLNKVLSYNSFLNFLVGERGVGKSYSTTKFFISQFIKKGSQFAYIRRYKTELKKDAPQFFDAMIEKQEFKGHSFKYQGEKFYIDEKLAGYAMTLTTAQNLKGSNFPKVKYIVFDEFIIEDTQHHYLQNEVMNFLGLIESIARLRDVKIFMLGNACSLVNPYFLFFDISLPYQSDIKLYKEGLILLNYMQNKEYREFKKQTKFGKLVSGTQYEEYAIDNKFLNENNDFIQKKTQNAKCSFAISYKNNIYGIWLDYNEGKVFVSNSYNTQIVFATTNSDLKPNTMLFSIAKKLNCWKVFIDNYKLGNVYYESQKIKLIIQDVLTRIIN